jgi:hypothetical protein
LTFFSDEKVVIHLKNENDLMIAKYECNAKQFLYPKPQLRPKYSKSSREVLMDCCFLPIAPKLEFSAIVSIQEDIKTIELSRKEFDSESDSMHYDL